LLKRLGQAVHGSVVNSDQVRECLEQLREDGWNAVMLLEASVTCRDKEVRSGPASVRIHVEPASERIDYRIDVEDARFLRSLGISPSRHRSQSSARRRDSGGSRHSS
jgi:hypothetical protein